MSESQAKAIVAEARRARPRTPRWLWILAGVVGAGCAVAFALAMLAGGEASPGTLPGGGSRSGAGGSGVGFAAGLAIGLAAGVAIGVAVARQLASHSSRNRP